MYRELRAREEFFAEHADLRGSRRMVTGTKQRESGLLGVGDLAVAIHGDQIGWTQEAERARFFTAGGNLGHGDILEYGLKRVEEVEVFAAGRMLVRADQHFFGATTTRN